MYNLFSKSTPATKLPLFNFASETHFVTSSDGATLKVYELTDPTVHPSSIRRTHFKELAEIHHDGVGLQFSSGRGRIEGREALTALAIHLAQLRLLATPEGHCLQDVTGLQMYADHNIHYLRLNDLFPWSTHGVEPKTASPTPALLWRRFELNRPQGKTMENTMTQYTTIRKDKLVASAKEVWKLQRENEELRKALTKKGEEAKKKEEEAKKRMQDLHKEKGKKSGEATGLRFKCMEQQRLLKMKDNEIEKLKQLMESMKHPPPAGRTLSSYIPTMDTARQVGNTINNTASYIHNTAKYLADTAVG